MLREISSDKSWYSASVMYSGSSSNHQGLLMGIIFARSLRVVGPDRSGSDESGQLVQAGPGGRGVVVAVHPQQRLHAVERDVEPGLPGELAVLVRPHDL